MVNQKKNQRGYILMEIVIAMAILLMVGSVGTFGTIATFKNKWKMDTATILQKAREAYLEHYVATGTKITSSAPGCDYNTGQTNCTIPAPLVARMSMADGLDGYNQPLLLWTGVRVQGQLFDAAICSNGGDGDFGPVPDSSKNLDYSPLEQTCAFVNIPTMNARAKTQAAVDASRSVWMILKSTATDPGCATDPNCVGTMALNGLLDWSFVVDAWGHPILCDTTTNPKKFYSAGSDGCYAENNPTGCAAGSEIDNIINN